MIGRILAVAGAVCVALGVAWMAYTWWPRAPVVPAGPLVEGWAAGVDTFVLDVPEGCRVQRLNYTAWQQDDALPARIEFAVSQMGDPVSSTGTAVEDLAQDVVDLPLTADQVYALTVRGVNARWRFAVTCLPEASGR